jgi:hypothetical protein
MQFGHQDGEVKAFRDIAHGELFYIYDNTKRALAMRLAPRSPEDNYCFCFTDFPTAKAFEVKNGEYFMDRICTLVPDASIALLEDEFKADSTANTKVGTIVVTEKYRALIVFRSDATRIVNMNDGAFIGDNSNCISFEKWEVVVPGEDEKIIKQRKSIFKRG